MSQPYMAKQIHETRINITFENGIYMYKTNNIYATGCSSTTLYYSFITNILPFSYGKISVLKSTQKTLQTIVEDFHGN
jgi:hypothetical protein